MDSETTQQNILLCGGQQKELLFLDEGLCPLKSQNAFHKDRVWDILSVGNGQYATCSQDTTVKVFETQTQKLVYVLGGHKGAVYSMSHLFFNSNVHLVASCSRDQTLKLWNLTHEKCMWTITDHTDCVRDVTFLSGQNWLATASWDRSIGIFDVEKKRNLKMLRKHENWARCLFYDDVKQVLYSAGNDHMLFVWDTRNLEVVGKMKKKDIVYSMLICPQRNMIITGDEKGMLETWDTRMLSEINSISQFKAHKDVIWKIKNVGDRFVTCSNDCYVRLWEMDDHRVKFEHLCDAKIHTVEYFDNQLISLKQKRKKVAKKEEGINQLPSLSLGKQVVPNKVSLMIGVMNELKEEMETELAKKDEEYFKLRENLKKEISEKDGEIVKLKAEIEQIKQIPKVPSFDIKEQNEINGKKDEILQKEDKHDLQEENKSLSSSPSRELDGKQNRKREKSLERREKELKQREKELLEMKTMNDQKEEKRLVLDEKKYRERQKALEVSFERRENHLKQKVEELEKRLHDKQSDHQRTVSEKNGHHLKEMEKLKRKNQAEIAKLRNTHVEELERIRMDGEETGKLTAMSLIKSEHDKQIKALEVNLENARATLREERNRNVEMKSTVNSQMTTIRELERTIEINGKNGDNIRASLEEKRKQTVEMNSTINEQMVEIRNLKSLEEKFEKMKIQVRMYEKKMKSKKEKIRRLRAKTVAQKGDPSYARLVETIKKVEEKDNSISDLRRDLNKMARELEKIGKSENKSEEFDQWKSKEEKLRQNIFRRDQKIVKLMGKIEYLKEKYRDKIEENKQYSTVRKGREVEFLKKGQQHMLSLAKKERKLSMFENRVKAMKEKLSKQSREIHNLRQDNRTKNIMIAELQGREYFEPEFGTRTSRSINARVKLSHPAPRPSTRLGVLRNKSRNREMRTSKSSNRFLGSEMVTSVSRRMISSKSSNSFTNQASDESRSTPSLPSVHDGKTRKRAKSEKSYNNTCGITKIGKKHNFG